LKNHQEEGTDDLAEKETIWYSEENPKAGKSGGIVGYCLPIVCYAPCRSSKCRALQVETHYNGQIFTKFGQAVGLMDIINFGNRLLRGVDSVLHEDQNSLFPVEERERELTVTFNT